MYLYFIILINYYKDSLHYINIIILPSTIVKDQHEVELKVAEDILLIHLYFQDQHN
jgi:hypothetical protein